ncbi:hypothetical protein SSS_02289 [Sarcoptes scabiei]|uniref:Uncharacterized protein n=1 Tax=Sarcoptes scabiei TaxID=52283 RepID=A0A834RFZ5_SARSC|nr:hypothetical protein SSS_02289 [Sarcoptes scabiei]
MTEIINRWSRLENSIGICLKRIKTFDSIQSSILKQFKQQVIICQESIKSKLLKFDEINSKLLNYFGCDPSLFWCWPDNQNSINSVAEKRSKIIGWLRIDTKKLEQFRMNHLKISSFQKNCFYIQFELLRYNYLSVLVDQMAQLLTDLLEKKLVQCDEKESTLEVKNINSPSDQEASKSSTMMMESLPSTTDKANKVRVAIEEFNHWLAKVIVIIDEYDDDNEETEEIESESDRLNGKDTNNGTNRIRSESRTETLLLETSVDGNDSQPSSLQQSKSLGLRLRSFQDLSNAIDHRIDILNDLHKIVKDEQQNYEFACRQAAEFIIDISPSITVLETEFSHLLRFVESSDEFLQEQIAIGDRDHLQIQLGECNKLKQYLEGSAESNFQTIIETVQKALRLLLVLDSNTGIINQINEFCSINGQTLSYEDLKLIATNEIPNSMDKIHKRLNEISELFESNTIDSKIDDLQNLIDRFDQNSIEQENLILAKHQELVDYIQSRRRNYLEYRLQEYANRLPERLRSIDDFIVSLRNHTMTRNESMIKQRNRNDRTVIVQTPSTIAMNVDDELTLLEKELADLEQQINEIAINFENDSENDESIIQQSIQNLIEDELEDSREQVVAYYDELITMAAEHYLIIENETDDENIVIDDNVDAEPDSNLIIEVIVVEEMKQNESNQSLVEQKPDKVESGSSSKSSFEILNEDEWKLNKDDEVQKQSKMVEIDVKEIDNQSMAMIASKTQTKLSSPSLTYLTYQSRYVFWSHLIQLKRLERKIDQLY